jgi:transcriptional regulator with XRE-family HTH domain
MQKNEVVLVTKKGRATLGELLREYRERQGWSLDRLAEEVYAVTGNTIVKSTISNLERGNTVPTCDTLLLLSQVGYLPFTFTQLVDIATENRLSVCEKGYPYKISACAMAV